MKTAVLSGKGGTGKTFVSVNLAYAAGNSVYVDCDVEEPDGRLFLKPTDIKREDVFTLVPDFDMEKCIQCRQCVSFCRFNAIVFIKDNPKIFNEVCHACGGCALVCPANAITEKKRKIGVIETGKHGNITAVTGIMDISEASGVKIIEAALKKGASFNADTEIIDCPPGSACSVNASLKDADSCIIVAEPTAFGFHNFLMVHELVSILKKPCFVVINKQDKPYEPLENYCREQGIEIAARIPFDRKIAKLISVGEIAAEKDKKAAEIFSHILSVVKGEKI